MTQISDSAPAGAESIRATATADDPRLAAQAVAPARQADGAGLRHVLARPYGVMAEMARMRRQSPFYDSRVDEIAGRRIRIDGRWLIDFASCNYLGFDLDREIIEAVPEYLDRWGTHPSWSRIIANPRLFTEIEQSLSELLGAPDTLLLPTISHIHLSVLPALVGQGALFVEVHAHSSVHDGAAMASGRGATVRRFREARLDRLDRALRACRLFPRVIAIDGVNSMTGNGPQLAEILAVARSHEAVVYIDDAHGFGVIGERSPAEPTPYGLRGNGVVRHLGQSYDDVVMVGGFSKSYSSLLAFATCPTELKDYLKTMANPYIFSGPPPVASLATAQVGLRVNAERGEQARLALHTLTARALAGIRSLGLATLNSSGHPIIEIPLTDPGPDDADALGAFLFERGIYVTVAPFPLVPRDQVGVRVQVTAANTEAEIDTLLDVLSDAARRFPLRRLD
ncbi:pyridoxal phosphate-dependent aminotransferase family protein [Parafrankia sp. EUN1f]|uniref:aminotransferase class I/II-fold pyridoxal phosphate-dependent enzyme n=1 Tax=Parafrankia sp. EUN1f TaxID=102897 RepID=UPI0001C43A19|nr:pyridoxal phosphate-dependent aminotransferase family protein [Parafrankia sp. EUN1f]EFC84918.1 aminotransferase class I and II [Parafrankia sp. EUN1f]